MLGHEKTAGYAGKVQASAVKVQVSPDGADGGHDSGVQGATFVETTYARATSGGLGEEGQANQQVLWLLA